LEYAGNVWSPWKIKEIESIERVQKRATKMVKECVGLKYEERLKALNLPCLRYRRTRGDLIMVFNMLRNHEDCHCYPHLKRHQDDRTRGHNYKLDKIRFCKNMRKFYFSNRVVTSWNHLSNKVVNSTNVNEFKNNLDDFMRRYDFIFNYELDIVI